MLHCTHCHKNNRQNASFCMGCGKALPAPPATTLAPFQVGAQTVQLSTPSASQATAPPGSQAQATHDAPTILLDPKPSVPPASQAPPAHHAAHQAAQVTPTCHQAPQAVATVQLPVAKVQSINELGKNPLPPLHPGCPVAGQFEIVKVLESDGKSNLYSARNLTCPKCGRKGERLENTFCTECGMEFNKASGPIMCQLREALTPEAIGARAEQGVFYNHRFYLPLKEPPVTLPAPQALTLSAGYASDTGMVRELDEDSVFVLTLGEIYDSFSTPMGLFIVADGMGGHEGGEVASKLVVQTIAHRLMKHVLLPRLDPDSTPHQDAVRFRVIEAVQHANQELFKLAQKRGNDMGCTLTMALVINNRAYIANVGDSRTYIRRQNGLHQISKDHSVVANLIENGMAQPEEIYTHPDRNIVYRSMGAKPKLEVDLWEEELTVGDKLLLCCDGLWESIYNEGIDEVLLTHFEPQPACKEMIRRANMAGGEDNISVILVQVN